MTHLPITDLTSYVRSVLRSDDAQRREGMSFTARLGNLMAALENIEKNAPSRDPSAFETANLDAFGYATVLGFMNEHDPLVLQDMDDPVRQTIDAGVLATKLCLERGLKIVRVPACEHVTQRYAKVTHVNAYPVAVLAEVLLEGTN